MRDRKKHKVAGGVPVTAGLPGFRDPTSVAIVGASADVTKWGHWLARGALAGSHRRSVFLINHRNATVLGVECYTRIGQCPAAPELVVICVPPGQVIPVVEEALRAGSRAFLCLTSPVPQQTELAALIKQAGGRLIGPNSLGLVDTAAELFLAWGHFQTGPLAVISQSGQLGTEIAGLGAAAGIGVSRFVSVGNQIDVTAAELLHDLLTHPTTEVVAVYLENFETATHLLPVLQQLRLAGTPVLLLTVGGSAGSSRLAVSHTGSITSELDEIDAFCRAAGALRVQTPGELIDIAQGLLGGHRLTGRRVAVLGDSGGQCGVAADILSGGGLDLPALSVDLQHELAGLLPVGAAVANPIDLAGGGEADLQLYAALTEMLLASGEVDAVVLTGYFGSYGVDTVILAGIESAVAQQLAQLHARHGGALFVHSMAGGQVPASPALVVLREAGIPIFDRIESLARSISGCFAVAKQPVRQLFSPAQIASRLPVGYWEVRNELMSKGITLPQAEMADVGDDFGDVSLSPPYALKADWIAHKTEQAAVVLGLETAEAAQRAHHEMVTRLGPGRYVLEEQDTRPAVVEMLIGFRRDENLGPLITVGAGGVLAEMYADSVVELAPVDLDTAAGMIGRLRCAPALGSWRGRPAMAVGELAAMVAAVSEYGSARTDIAELELNPVRVGPDLALAVDALVVPRSADTSLGRPRKEVSTTEWTSW